MTVGVTVLLIVRVTWTVDAFVVVPPDPFFVLSAVLQNCCVNVEVLSAAAPNARAAIVKVKSCILEGSES